MSIKLSELELPFLRKTIEIDRYGETHVVNVFNLLGEKRLEIVKLIEESTMNGLNNQDVVASLNERILSECTDLDLDVDVSIIFNSPSIEFIEIQSEVNEIIHELQCEAMTSYINKINQTEILLYADLAIKKSNNMNSIIELIKDVERADKKIDDIKKEDSHEI